MPAHSRPKDGVPSHAYVAGIHVFLARKLSKTWVAGTSPAMTKSKRPGMSSGAHCSPVVGA